MQAPIGRRGREGGTALYKLYGYVLLDGSQF